jgi:hypothetical protein
MTTSLPASTKPKPVVPCGRYRMCYPASHPCCSARVRSSVVTEDYLRYCRATEVGQVFVPVTFAPVKLDRQECPSYIFLEARPRSPLRLRASKLPATRRLPILSMSDTLNKFVVDWKSSQSKSTTSAGHYKFLTFATGSDIV